MNIDGINYHTVTDLAEARRCSISRLRQILAEEKIEPRLKLASLYTDTQAAIVSRPGKRPMNIDGINYHTITDLAEARSCSIARIRQILAEEKIKPRLKLASLYTDTQAAIVQDHHSGGPAGRPVMLTAWQILREIAHSRQLASPVDMFADGVSANVSDSVFAMYRWQAHARNDCPVKTLGYIKQQVSPFLGTPLERLPAWRMADHDAVLEWAIADLPAV